VNKDYHHQQSNNMSDYYKQRIEELRTQCRQAYDRHYRFIADLDETKRDDKYWIEESKNDCYEVIRYVTVELAKLDELAKLKQPP
jgi:uncharacterized protein YqiB (DUF1249 family)